LEKGIQTTRDPATVSQKSKKVRQEKNERETLRDDLRWNKDQALHGEMHEDEGRQRFRRRLKWFLGQEDKQHHHHTQLEKRNSRAGNSRHFLKKGESLYIREILILTGLPDWRKKKLYT